LNSVSAQVDEAVRVLRGGGLVAYPTDTVYGLGASMSSAEAVERVFAVKARPRQMALPLLVGSVAQIEALAEHVSGTARCLIEAFFPGAITLVMPASGLVPEYLRTREGTIALRIPNHAVPRAIIQGLGAAIVGTSANLSGRPNPLTAEEVLSQLGPNVDMVIDGGRCPGTESTIIDVTGEVPVVLRRGAISVDEIRRVCGRITVGDGGS
jgi:L-threonylcarbamoyladenylate synthase